jgi:LacI family transcriptional regulator
VDGYLITPTPGMENDIKNLIKNNKPVVLMDRFLPGLDVPFTLVDNYAGVKLGMEHLLEKGYKNIAFVTLDTQQIQMLQREKGYKETLQRHGIKVRNELIEKIPFKSRPEDAIKQVSEFIKYNPDIDAIFFATNYLGMYGLESIKKAGLKIPEEIGVICFDDHDIFRLFTPAITIIRQPIEEIARSAIEMLISLLENNHTVTAESHVYKKPELVIRSST